ncbi:MAG TPA: ABC transporter ATP-binding protein [Myxococcaceae bacterium]|nr:ABC transporter ATP-binding protein [Myxococcaceae bacterium]
MASVTLRSLRKRYPQGSEGVRGIDLEIRDGEFLTLVGPSGCGKSTTLNMIAGLETPTGGRILFDGQDVTVQSPRERDVAMVFQSYALYPHLTVKENLRFPLNVRGLDRTEASRRVDETSERLGLRPFLDRKPGQLSGGQRQRVALGRALVRRAKVFLFDEPLSNLDAALRTQTRAEIKKLHEELKATFIYVTHDQAEAMTLSDRLAVMNAGELQQVAGPREIYDRPANTFVAGFVGSPSINLLPSEAWPALGGNGAQLGIRPEHLEVLRAPSPGTVAGRVYVVEPIGPETWVTVQVGERRVVARAPGDFHAVSGEPVWLRADPARALRFDAQLRRV